ncbi:short-chain dehydrogenase, putative [Paecilomyces variotii No. 5]|uniref:Short-chain dehydrogenase, putative n=1 Tax=Byssochlamys spectabilis (strain No. 5 / NBRC 109023) TaxID=1356009 RepID=V5FIH1_BYSSN|nr:short-chain dehydrogenase, putative [Paecilomyces variotii No. 5]
MRLPSPRNLLQKPLAQPTCSFAGKNILVTGANTGLGFEAAQKFTALGASRVILGVRDLKKGERAKSLIEERTGVKDRIDVWQLDMNSYQSIREFAVRADATDISVDIALLNAGVYSVNYRQSPYGWEETLQVNVLSTALLALLLLPKLRKSSSVERNNNGAVLEFVSSRRHEVVTISEDRKRRQNLLRSFNNAETFKSSEQYQVSKLFVMCIMQVLSSLAKTSGVRVTAICPGFCQSDLSRGHQGIVAGIIRTILNTLVLRTAEEGSRTLVSGAALGPEAHGMFWYDDELHQASAPILAGPEGEDFRRKIWGEVIEALKMDVPEVEERLGELEGLEQGRQSN